MKSRKTQSENKKITISSLYQYVFEDKAKPEIVIHESSKKEKKVTTYVQCSLLLQANSPINNMISGATKPVYVLAPEGLYYVADPSKPVSNADLIEESKKEVGKLWKGVGNKNNTTPYDAKLTEINAKQQRTITMHTKHLPREKTEEELISSSKIIKKITTAEEAKQKMLSSKTFKQQKKISEFTDLLNDQQLSLIFRQMLRTVGSQSLELLLFENTTDILPESIPQEYAFLSDDEIKIKFDELESHYHFFSDDNEQGKNEFVTLFKGCKLIADYIEKNNDDDNNVAALHAYKMLVLFGYNESKKANEKSYSFQNVDAYLDQHGDSQSTHPIHDLLISDIPINQTELEEEIKDIVGWRKFIHKYGKQAIDYFQQAPAIEHILKQAPIDLGEAKIAAEKIRYARDQEYPALAKLCLQYHLSEDNFNKCLEIDKKRKSFDNLPDISIDGKTVGHPNYFLVKLPIDDPRAYILGHITRCCQSIGGESEKCVIDGITRINNGFYVLLKRNKSGETISQPLQNNQINYKDFSIVGQGYLCLSKEENTYYDSWENLHPERDDPIIVSILPEWAKKVTASSPEILRITIGNGGKTPKGFDQYIPNQERERIAEGYQYGDSKFQSLIYLDQGKLNKLTNQLIEKNTSDWDTETLNQIIDIDKIYSTEQIKRIDSLFLQKDSHILWDEVSGNDRNLPQSERQKIMRQFFMDHQLLFTHDVIAIMDILHQIKILNSEYIQRILQTISNMKSPSNFILGMRILGYAGLINAENIDIILNNAEAISDNAKNYEVLLPLDLLTENVLETTIKHPNAIDSTKSATGMLAKEGILTNDILKIIFDVYIATKDKSTGYTAEYTAEEKAKVVANNLIALHKVNIPLTDETLLNACTVTPNSMQSIIAGLTGAMQFYNKKQSPMTDSHETAGKFIDAPVLIKIFKKLLAGKYVNEEEEIDPRENLLTILSAFSVLLYKKGIITNENFDEMITHIKNPAISIGLNILMEEDLLVNANFNILINNAKDAESIAKEMVMLKKSLTRFVEQLKPREKSSQFTSIFSSDDQSSNQRYIEVANKLLQILQGEKQVVPLDESDREILKKNKQLSNIINDCVIVPNLLNLVDKKEQLYFLIYKESPDDFSFNKDYPFTVVSPKSKEDIMRIYKMADLMGMTEAEMLPLNMSKQEFNQLLNEISSGDSGVGFPINEIGRSLLKSTNEKQQDKSLEPEIIMHKKKT